MPSKLTLLSHAARGIVKTAVVAVVWTLVGLYAAVALLLQLPAVQGAVAGAMADFVGGKLGTRVEVGRVDVGMLNRLIIDNVAIYDQAGHPMARARRLSLRLGLPDRADQIAIASAQLLGVRLSLYQTAADKPANYQFALDALASKDTTKTKTPDISVRALIAQRCAITYDKLFLPRHPGRLDPAHIAIDGLGAYIAIGQLSADSVNCRIRSLRLRESCGLQLTNLAAELAASRRHVALRNMALQMPGTDIGLEYIEASYTFRADTLDRHSLTFRARLLPSSVALADLAPVLPDKAPKDGHIEISATASGTAHSADISSLSLAWNGAWLRLQTAGHVCPDGWQALPTTLQIDQRGLDALADIFPQAAIAPRAGHIDIGLTAQGSGKAISGKADIATAIGGLRVEASTRDCRTIAAKCNLRTLDIAKLLSMPKTGPLTAKAEGKIALDGGKVSHIDAKADIASAQWGGATYKDLHCQAAGTPRKLAAKLSADNPNLRLDANATLQTSGRAWHATAQADLRHIRTKPLGLKGILADATGSMRLDADVAWDGRANADGHIDIRDAYFASATQTLALNKLSVRAGRTPTAPNAEKTEDASRYIAADGDFGRIQIVGRYDLRTLAASFAKLATRHLPSLPIARQQADNNISIAAHISDTQLLRQLAGIELDMRAPLTLRGHINDNTGEAAMEAYAPNFTYAGADYSNAFLSLSTPGDSLCLGLTITKALGDGRRMDIATDMSAADDRLAAQLRWNSNARKPHSGTINLTSRFSDGKLRPIADVEIMRSQMAVGQQQWNISPAHITYAAGRLAVEHFDISHGPQHLRIDGIASKEETDSLTADLRDIDLAYILDLVNFHSVEFSGRASGKATVKAPLGKLAAAGHLTVADFRFEDGRMGTLEADVAWNGKENKIEIDAIADDSPARTIIKGYVATAPSPGHINLDIDAQDTSIEFMQSFTKSFASGVGGKARGKLTLAGDLDNINLTGRLAVEGRMHIDALGCDYTLQADTVDLIPDDILLTKVEIHDPQGHTARVAGGIHHRHLTHLSYDMDIQADRLLAYHFTDFGSELFYGTVYGTGQVGISGSPGRVDIDINVRPERGSSLTYDATRTDDVTSLDFIRWRDITPTKKAGANAATQDFDDSRTDIRLSFVVPMNTNAAVRVLMDKTTNDYITLHGTGVIRASYYNKGAFNMFGTYAVESGSYGLTIQNIIKKNFTFSDGGRIVFGGDPYNATLSLQAVHTVSGVSLADLGLGGGGARSTTRANCLMDITGTPAKPQVSFDLDLPQVSADERQMVRSVINSQDEMSQQVLYLLGVGRFYPSQANNQAAEDGRNYSQTTLAMQGLLSGTLSSQINNLLQGALKSDNWSFGANINTGDEGWNNAEYEGQLSGRLLSGRLLIDGQFGYRDNTTTAGSSFIGDFDVRYLLTPGGGLAANIYNKANDRYFTKAGLNTQGIGLIMKKDFSTLRDLFGIKGKTLRLRKPKGK